MAAAIKARVEREYAAAKEMISRGHTECHCCYWQIGAMLFHKEDECKTKPICYNEKGREKASIDTDDFYEDIDDLTTREWFEMKEEMSQKYGMRAITAVFGTTGKDLALEYKIRSKMRGQRESDKYWEAEEAKEAARKAEAATKEAEASAARARMDAAIPLNSKPTKGKKTVEKFSLDDI